MTRHTFVSMATFLGVFKVSQSIFLQKALIKDTVPMVLILVLNESATAKIACDLSKADSQRKLCGLDIN